MRQYFQDTLGASHVHYPTIDVIRRYNSSTMTTRFISRPYVIGSLQ